MSPASPEVLTRLRSLVSRERLACDTVDLCSVFSRTGEAGPALDRLEEILYRDGFTGERSCGGGGSGGYRSRVRLRSGQPGPTLQFNGHLDTVHLPFVPPQVVGDRITGTGSCDAQRSGPSNV